MSRDDGAEYGRSGTRFAFLQGLTAAAHSKRRQSGSSPHVIKRTQEEHCSEMTAFKLMFLVFTPAIHEQIKPIYNK
eukprot:4470212-Amphidinium_carterae.1